MVISAYGISSARSHAKTAVKTQMVLVARINEKLQFGLQTYRQTVAHAVIRMLHFNLGTQSRMANQLQRNWQVQRFLQVLLAQKQGWHAPGTVPR